MFELAGVREIDTQIYAPVWQDCSTVNCPEVWKNSIEKEKSLHSLLNHILSSF